MDPQLEMVLVAVFERLCKNVAALTEEDSTSLKLATLTATFSYATLDGPTGIAITVPS